MYNNIPLINAADIYGNQTDNLFGYKEDNPVVKASGEITGTDKMSTLAPTYSWIGMVVLLILVRLIWEMA
jgi:hypothetical protein